LCFVSLTDAADKFDKKDFQTNATFELVVEKSKFLTPGTSEIASQSAFVSLAHGLIPGNSDGLEIMFFTKAVTESALPDIMTNDAKELRRSSHAALVLYLDKDHKVSNLSFERGRVLLKSIGNYSETGQEVMKLSWNVDLDLPVKREVNRRR
jgi:hypothetical protein